MSEAREVTLTPAEGGTVRLGDLFPTVLVFAHEDCPTSRLALRRLSALDEGVVLVAEEEPAAAARLARRAGVRFRVLAQSAALEASHALGVEAVPTAVRVGREGEVEDTVVGWNADAYERLLGRELPDGEPRFKPGCASRAVHDWSAPAGLDELEDMFERGWTDGLPVVPPTPERVERMLAGRDAAHSLGAVPPTFAEATLERVAACAVLAGCRPEYFPVVVAAVEAALDPEFNLHGQAVTTQPAGQVLVVNGPVRDEIGLNAEMGAFGPGFRANLTIGRAVRLVVALTGGGYPGRLDRATLGQPGKISFCFAENEEASPWEPLHVERGLDRGSSAVTLVAADAPLSISDHRSQTAEQLSATLGWAAASLWSPFWWPLDATSLYAVCPEHADLFRAEGWSKELVRETLYRAVSRRAHELRGAGETTSLVLAAEADERIPRWDDPDRILLVVAGGPAGRFSAVLGPCVGMEASVVTREVR
ncbi:MAG: thioredoxin [Thermoleophilia bacterium]|nr:thioredoxin [Thermoleophilia bacterium]